MTCTKLLELLPSAVMAVFLAYIAYQQMVINKRRLNLDLYSKRFSVYTDVVRFHQELAEEMVSQETHRNFIASKEASRFLFSKDSSIFELLQLMHTESFKIIGFKHHAKELSEASFIEGFASSQEVFFWWDRQMAELKEKMKPYLDQ
ncbi:hypothetical protein DWB84_07330 [Saccharophagus sp. K07]|jgi:ribosome biogenesis protein Nip4|uniref:hypothetical protein n=1 Tax=Saccharophagus sp. K07 TaxID=2283636 RepID=UPI001651B4D6|nr:hypothetical protein [Saccharophagus sp. K07]MBC6905272.1 hypothetical protein [Saccharophagus sp. K07]